MVQTPADNSETELDETAHTEAVFEEKLTGKPDDAVANGVTFPEANTTLGKEAKEIVCAAGVMGSKPFG